ncbi:MAG: type II toxin-antitoxin system HicB family antitoxin [Chloroflexota bacterium]|nr:type II toxin-antitoxin system HicB family antitoxin [Chloroflexota bacterium]
MNRQLLQQAENLGNRPYQMMIFLDKTTDGEPIYVALIPELPGCHTHGDTVEEALELLNEVKVEFIYFMLEDGLAIPDPKPLDKGIRMNFGDLLDNDIAHTAKPSAPRGAFLDSEANARQIA